MTPFDGLEDLFGFLFSAAELDQFVVELLYPHTDTSDAACFHSREFLVAECLGNALQRDLDIARDVEHAAHNIHQGGVLISLVEIRRAAAKVDACEL